MNKLFFEKYMKQSPEDAQELVRMLTHFIDRFEKKAEMDLLRFHTLDEKRNPTGVLDMVILYSAIS